MDIVRSEARRYSQLPRFFRWFSDHCVLRQLDESDVARIVRATARPGFERLCNGRAPRNAEEIADFVRSAQADWLRGTRYVMAVVRKQTHDFVGWVELRAAGRGRWMLVWFIQPEPTARPLAREVLLAAADLMFTALDAQALYADCPRGHVSIEHLLNDAGFIELVPAGSLDHQTGRPRAAALYELGRADWHTLRATRTAVTALHSRVELALV
jgi:RimJ/RimL family protein N-acetyltransferase